MLRKEMQQFPKRKLIVKDSQLKVLVVGSMIHCNALSTILNYY